MIILVIIIIMNSNRRMNSHAVAMEEPSNGIKINVDQLIEFIEKNFDKQPISDHSEHVSMESDKKQTDENDNITIRLKNLFGKFSNKIKPINVISVLPNYLGDLSLCTSILSCLIENFDTLDENNQNIVITKFFEKFLGEVKKRDGITRVTTPILKWDKKELVKSFTENNMTKSVIAYVMMHLNINIFIINEEDDEIRLYSAKEVFNIYKQSIVLICEHHKSNFGNEESSYKPLTYDNNKFWNFNEPLKFMIDNHKEEIKLFRQNPTNLTANWEFTKGYDDDIEMIWDPKEAKKEIITDKKEDEKVKKDENGNTTDEEIKENKKYKKKPSETTEQLINAVFEKKSDESDTEKVIKKNTNKNKKVMKDSDVPEKKPIKKIVKKNVSDTDSDDESPQKKVVSKKVKTVKRKPKKDDNDKSSSEDDKKNKKVKK